MLVLLLLLLLIWSVRLGSRGGFGKAAVESRDNMGNRIREI